MPENIHLKNGESSEILDTLKPFAEKIQGYSSLGGWWFQTVDGYKYLPINVDRQSKALELRIKTLTSALDELEPKFSPLKWFKSLFK